MSSQSMTSGWYMSDSNWDAIKITPNRRVRLVGTGVFGPTGDPPSKPAGWKLEFKIVQDGNELGLFIFESSDDNWDEEHKIYKCIFRDHGFNDITADEGSKVEVCQRYKEGPRPQHRYLESGKPDGIDGQEKDFKIERSSFDGNCTNDNRGQIPCLLYQYC